MMTTAQTRPIRKDHPKSVRPDHATELQAVLAAWQSATDRLQKTHETLQHEVKRLTDELEIKNRELARKNRLADLGQMASHVAHDVRNSLVPLTLYLSLLRRHLAGSPNSVALMDKIDSGFTALEAIVNDLLQFTSQRDPMWQPFDLGKLVNDVCEGLLPQLEAQGIRTELDIPAGLTLVADPEMMRRAVLNLLLNALDVMRHGGELTITGIAICHGIELEIADSGPGLGDDEPRRLFEPFFTTKDGGTGLGLAIVERMATAHGGEIIAANCAQGGAAFTIRIPNRSMETVA